MLGKTRKEYTQWKRTMENDLVNRFPTISQNIERIDLQNSTHHPLTASEKASALYMHKDSRVCTKEALAHGVVAKDSLVAVMPDATKRYIDTSIEKFVAGGMPEVEAKHKVQDSLQTFFGYDASKGQYVVTAVPPATDNRVNDSVLGQLAIPMWNVGVLTKVFKQPFATSHAKNLVSVESFSNPFADIVTLFKESFEGYGKISTVAKGNVKQNNSNPLTNEASQIVSDVFNLSIDYESDIWEDIKARQAGNFLTGQLKADRERYGAMVLDRMQDALIYFGSSEAGIDGLIDVADVQLYTGTPLYDILSSASTTKGADIVLAMNKLIGDFLRANHYMPNELRINVSEYVFQALTQTVYSDQFDPSSPLKILSGNFKGTHELDGGLKQCKYTIISDTMLNPNTPFNPNPYDLAFMTVPSITDAMGTQDSLIIHPELLKNYVVPPLPTRNGILYTSYKRIGSIIAPIENTVGVVRGLGYQG